MKIAIFYNLYFSGAKRTVFEHVKGLKKLGYVVDIYTCDSQNDFFDPGGVANKEYRYVYKSIIFAFPFLRKLSNDLSDYFILSELHKKIAKDIDKGNYDIALIHTDQLTQAPFILKFLKTKKVYFCLEPLKIAYEYSLRMPKSLPLLNRVYEIINRYIRKKIDRENAQAADDTFTISKFGRELMIQSFDLYPKVSYLGVDTDLFRNTHSKKKNQILFIGQKIKMNGYEYAVNAMKYIPEKIRPELKVISISKDKKKILTDNEIVKLYNESLITLSLSNLDTFGLVPLESAACEVPVVAFDVAGYRETILDGKTGYLVDFDSKEIALKIIDLIKNSKQREILGKQGREWVMSKWTWDRQIFLLDKLLKNVFIED